VSKTGAGSERRRGGGTGGSGAHKYLSQDMADNADFAALL